MEIFHEGAWGTICDDSWDLNDANVVCRQLRFPGAAQASGSAKFGSGNKTNYTSLVCCTLISYITA